MDVATGQVLATATGVYVAADAARKQELRARYGVRPIGAEATGTTPAPREPGTPEPVDAGG